MPELFKGELFVEKIYFEERPLVDRKAWVDFSRNDKKGEFIRDVIALANTARMLGKHAYLLMGIEDKTYDDESEEPLICGIDPMLEWAEKELTNQGVVSSAFKLHEKIRGKIGELIAINISPSLPGCDFVTGEQKGKMVAYLVIPPIMSQEPFQVSRDFPSGGLRKTQWWMRFGESKQEITLLKPHEIPWLYAFSKAPYFLPTQWQNYMKKMFDEVSQEQEVDGYQKLDVKEGASLEAIYQSFLEDSDKHILIISGVAGVGKSTFIKRAAADWAQTGMKSIQGNIDRESYSHPPDWIPLYLSLRSKDVYTSITLREALTNRINELSNIWSHTERPDEPERIFEMPGTKWLICLDGLDEIFDEQGRKDFLRALSGFISHYSRTKILLTTRPYEGLGQWRTDSSYFEIAPLKRDQIDNLVASYISIKQYEYFRDLLDSEIDLQILCAVPAYLKTVFNGIIKINETLLPTDNIQNDSSDSFRQVGGETKVGKLFEDLLADDVELELISSLSSSQNESIQLGNVLDRMFRGLWQREEQRRTQHRMKTSLYWEMTANLAIEFGFCKEFRYEDTIGILRDNDALSWLLDLGVLQEHEQRTLGFFTKLTAAYFTYLFLLRTMNNQERKQVIKWFIRTPYDFYQISEIIVRDLSPKSIFVFSWFLRFVRFGLIKSGFRSC